MKILVGMMHPKHVYMFKNFINVMKKNGHEIAIITIDKDITEVLLKTFRLPFFHIGNNPPSLISKLVNIPIWTYRTLVICLRFKPDLFIGQAFPHFAYVSALFRKPYIIFEDTEIAQAVQAITFPFASLIVTPSCYLKRHGKKQISFDGYFELGYLHPNNFTPDPAVLRELGLTPGDPYLVIRFVSWQAAHDIGQKGIKNKINLVQSLEKYGRILITSEGPLPKELERYSIKISPEKLHDLLFYAKMYLGEGGTTATEAAVLGTPSVYISSLSGTLGNFIELEKTFRILECSTNSDEALEKAKIILNDPDSKRIWKANKDLLLKKKIDFTAFMVWLVENYPSSITTMREDACEQFRINGDIYD